MLPDDDQVRRQHLLDMLDHAGEAPELIAGRTRQNLQKDRLLDVALERLREALGAAADRVTAETAGQLTSISVARERGTAKSSDAGVQ